MSRHLLAALATVEHLGYTYHGGAQWKPPLGKSAEPLLDRITELKAQLETERMRLAACGVVAMANTSESAAKAREMLPEYKSASLSDVCRAVDAEIDLRAQLEAAKKDAERYQWLRQYEGGNQRFNNEMDNANCPTEFDCAVDAAIQAEGKA